MKLPQTILNPLYNVFLYFYGFKCCFATINRIGNVNMYLNVTKG